MNKENLPLWGWFITATLGIIGMFHYKPLMQAMIIINVFFVICIFTGLLIYGFRGGKFAG